MRTHPLLLLDLLAAGDDQSWGPRGYMLHVLVTTEGSYMALQREANEVVKMRIAGGEDLRSVHLRLCAAAWEATARAVVTAERPT